MNVVKMGVFDGKCKFLSKSCTFLLAVFAAAQAEADTALHIEKTEAGVVLTWPSDVDPNTRVDSSPVPFGSWRPRSELFEEVDLFWQMTIPMEDSAQFFRLFDPIAAAGVARGGSLYDNWATTLHVTPPTTNHPLWASRPDTTSNTRTGATTWRCITCHGFDYRGVDGNYGIGNRRTGIRGVFGTTKTDAELTDLIKNNHGYGALLSDLDVENLVQFLRRGMIDTTQILSGSTPGSVFKGDAARGSVLYQLGLGTQYGGCAVCHGTDGLFQPPGGPVPFHDWPGFKAKDNPWEFQHKVRYGHPGTTMPGSVPVGGDSIRDIADVAAYCQTLPASILPTVARGGALYDSWFGVLAVTGPTNNHPLWASRPDTTSNTRTGSVTWRCQTCHGFDYKGVDGAYGSGNRRTGIRGIFGTTKTPAELTELIATNHSYGTVLSAVDIQSLVLFIQQGQIDTATILNNKTFIGDSVRGEALYKSGIGSNLSCAACHGPTGLAWPPGYADFHDYPGFKAKDNPWEFQHKLRYGHPGTAMPGSVPAGGLTQDVADVAAYCQTLPSAPPAAPAP